MASSCTWGRILGKIFSWEGLLSPGTAAQDNGGVPIPRGIFKKCGCCTWGHELMVALAVLGEQMDSMVLKNFSNPKDSVTSASLTLCTNT